MRSLPGTVVPVSETTRPPEGLPFCNVCEYIYNFRFIAAIRFQPPKPTHKKTSKHRARALSLTLNLCGVQTRRPHRRSTIRDDTEPCAYGLAEQPMSCYRLLDELIV